MIDTTELEADIQARINALAGTESVEELFSLTSALRALTYKSFVSVQNYADLPNLTAKPMPSGSLIFVRQLNIMMMSVGTQWRGIDERVYVPTFITYGWGQNGSGRLGDNTTTNRSSPVTVVGGITTWSQVSAGDRHSLGLTSTGILYAWGYNHRGQLGDNTTSNRSSPVTVVGGITNWSQISAGSSYNNLALRSNGIAYAWGYNYRSQLGDGTATDRSSPVTVIGGITNWSQVSAGKFHGLGIAGGIAYGWGYNGRGALGDNTTTGRASPVTVVGGITTWSQLRGGEYHTIGLTASGVLYAWGYNGFGRLGDNTTSSRLSPVTVVGGLTSWNQISAGFRHSMGVTNAGIAYGWGYNGQGQLGDNTTSSRLSPVTVVGGITTWSEVASGGYFNLGRTSTGIAYGWGSGGYGKLGDNAATNRSSPVTVVGGITGWSQVAAGTNHSLGIKT